MFLWAGKPPVPSVDVSEMDELALLIEKDTGWTQNVDSVNLRLVKIWGQYRGALAALKLSVPRMPLEVVKIGCELFSTSIVLGARLEQAELCEHDA